jgi:hypothetical protein
MMGEPSIFKMKRRAEALLKYCPLENAARRLFFGKKGVKMKKKSSSSTSRKQNLGKVMFCPGHKINLNHGSRGWLWVDDGGRYGEIGDLWRQ